MTSEGSGASRAGGEGFHNEDAFVVEEGLGLYVVCDGAGGAPAGEIASRLAADAMEEFVERADEELELRGDRIAWTVVHQAMGHAMAAVADAEKDDPKLRGLATTVTMLLAQGDRGVIGHRGDSRAYLIRRDRVHQLTVDHELTEPVSNGAGADDALDVFALLLRPGDTIVLCTDGAEEVVQEDAIVRVARNLSPRLLASRIVSAAHRRNPGLDATAVVVRVRDEKEPGWLELSFPTRGTTFGHTLERAA